MNCLFRDVAALDPTGNTLKRINDLKLMSTNDMPYQYAAICSTTANLVVLKDSNYDFKKVDKGANWN